jgi:SAM-dependent methyltransferase
MSPVFQGEIIGIKAKRVKFKNGEYALAAWNELFLDESFIAVAPQPEVYKFVKVLEGVFPERPLSLWDLCCGAGRHTVLIARMGHHAYGSDISENGIGHARKWLEREGLDAALAVADMTDNPFADVRFHGAFSWDALHHNTMGNIHRAVDAVYNSLCDGGMFMASLLSTKSGGAHRKGNAIEKNTFVEADGPEAGVAHHYFNEQGIRDLFGKWRIESLVEIVTAYIEMELDYAVNPFPYTKWNVIAKK